MKKRVKIGPLRFAIKVIEDLKDEDGTSLDGHIVFNECEVRVRDGMCPQRLRQVMWHEVIHAILAMAGVGHDESLTEIVSNGVMAALIDNPWLGEPIERFDR